MSSDAKWLNFSEIQIPVPVIPENHCELQRNSPLIMESRYFEQWKPKFPLKPEFQGVK